MIGVIFKRYIYIHIYIALIGATALSADTGQGLKSPSSNSFDFTFNQDFQKETQVDKTLIEIGKTTVLDRRLNNLFYCKTDKNGTEYCPEGLAKARDYTAYSDGGYLENTGQITDYTNGTSVSNKGQVVDYANVKNIDNNIVSGTANFNYSASFCTDHFTKVILVPDGYDVHFILVSQNPSGSTDGRCNYNDYSSNWLQNRGVVGWNTPGAFKKINVVTFSNPVYSVEGFTFTFSSSGSGCSFVSGSGIGNTSRSSSDPYARGYAFDNQSLTNCGKSGRQTPTVQINFTSIYTRTVACPTNYTETTGAETSKGQCKRTVDYYYYEYTCPAEYKAINKGLTSCVKTDSGNTTDNTATLSQACNSATPPPSNCEKPISYKYYEYICEGKNAFNQGYTVVDKGMTSCTKTDTDKTKPNSNLANDCNVKTPPKNNCKSTEFTCDSTLFKPVFVDGKWQCSPFVCDGNMKCGYGTCPANTVPSKDKYMSPAYNPLRYAFSNKCNTPLCDYVFNRDVSYCERKACPVGDDIIEQNGKCYKLECPAGTYLSGDKCITGKY